MSPRSFTAEQIADVGSPKSPDDFFAQLSCFMPWILSFFSFLSLDDNPEVASLNDVVVRKKMPRVLAGHLCLDVLLAVQLVHKGI